VQQFVYSILKDPKQSRFVGELRSFTRRVAFFGRINSLAQLLLKLTSPGVPDIYQGTELWTLDLVDPDNRRPVDFEVRRNFLADLHSERQLEPGLAPLASELLANSEDGRIKLYILNKTLEYRRDNRRLFTEGSYEPLESIGANADHVCA